MMRFDGDTYEPPPDQRRLSASLTAVRYLMLDAKWRTLYEIQAEIAYTSEAGISARLRDLRKARFGGYTVQRRRRGEESRGLFEYRVVPLGAECLFPSEE